MELLVALLIWPFLLVAIFLVGLSFAAIDASYLILLALFIIVLFSIFSSKKKSDDLSAPALTDAQRLTRMREIAIVFCISLFLPLFARYMVSGFNNSLPAVLVALAVGFGALLWGLFLKDNRVLIYSNIIGGGLTILYCYFQIWSLGQLAQVISTAFGLVIAVVFSVIKLKDKIK